jgi:FixJ family two-component response regulator
MRRCHEAPPQECLPAPPYAWGPVKQTWSELRKMSERKLVLVVDDDEGMRDAVQGLLTETGFPNATYASAEELIAGGRIGEASCLISDFKLPSMSGLELLSNLRRQGVQIPMIVITGHDTPGLSQEAALRGAMAYLLKPFSARDLLETLENLHKPSDSD